ncbi:MAG: transporter [bacterium]|nr:transporter [bacterium]
MKIYRFLSYRTALLTVLLSLSLTPTLAHAAVHAHHSNDHGPIGVMGDHLHHTGELMVSYRYMRMRMSGNLDGTDRESTSQVLGDYMIAPRSMTMEMHMLGAMYGLTPQVSLMAMLPMVRLEMDHVRRMGAGFKTSSDGLGDIKVSALYQLWVDDDHSAHLHLGLSLPTGSITHKDRTPSGRVRLPYPMQIGSGTVDLLPGITYRGKRDELSWGGQAQLTGRLGTNNKDYRLGNAYEVTAWLSRRLIHTASGSVRLAWREWDDIHGRDSALTSTMVPTADPRHRGGSRLDLLIGTNIALQGALENHRLAIEVGRPIYQSLDGPQLETKWMFTLGWQYSFGKGL